MLLKKFTDLNKSKDPTQQDVADEAKAKNEKEYKQMLNRSKNEIKKVLNNGTNSTGDRL